MGRSITLPRMDDPAGRDYVLPRRLPQLPLEKISEELGREHGRRGEVAFLIGKGSTCGDAPDASLLLSTNPVPKPPDEKSNLSARGSCIDVGFIEHEEPQ